MAWTTPLTAVSNAALTAAQWNASLRDNMLITPAGLATAAGQIWVSTAANAGAMRTPSFGHTTASSTTSSAGFADLAAGAGPAVTVTTGVSVITSHGANGENSTAGAPAIMSWACSGATTIAADSSKQWRIISATGGHQYRGTVTHFTPGLTPGSNTFTAKYAVGSGGTATFSERHILAIPL